MKSVIYKDLCFIRFTKVKVACEKPKVFATVTDPKAFFNPNLEAGEFPGGKLGDPGSMIIGEGKSKKEAFRRAKKYLEADIKANYFRRKIGG